MAGFRWRASSICSLNLNRVETKRIHAILLALIDEAMRHQPNRLKTKRNETHKENTMILFVIALIVTVFLTTSIGWFVFYWQHTRDLRDEIERLQWELGAGVPKGR
jgi:hypothetical protein